MSIRSIRSPVPAWLLALCLLAACRGTPSAVCGDGLCTAGESSTACPQDCPSLTGRVETTHLAVEGIGRIAVQVASPPASRYPEGAGVIVLVPSPFETQTAFPADPDFTALGLIQVTFLWPGMQDRAGGLASEGDFDYGGDMSLQVLRDVIRFAAGRMADAEGRYLISQTYVAPLQEVGLYASGPAGLAAVGVLAAYGDSLPGLDYYVGRENPSVDNLICGEVGYYGPGGQPFYDPFYRYPAGYGPWDVTSAYNGLRWAAGYTEADSDFTGRPYLDLDASGSLSAADYLYNGAVPVLFGKRTYSTELTRALLDSGALTRAGWPTDLATPEQAASLWSARQTSGRFEALRDLIPDLRVMLVFGQADHAQVAADKPHIHHLFQGFRFEAGLWVRLNPDRAYVHDLLPSAGLDFPDAPADTQPEDWTQVASYAYPNLGLADLTVPLAAAAEMADRAHTGRWDENFGQVLYTYQRPTPQP